MSSIVAIIVLAVIYFSNLELSPSSKFGPLDDLPSTTPSPSPTPQTTPLPFTTSLPPAIITSTLPPATVAPVVTTSTTTLPTTKPPTTTSRAPLSSTTVPSNIIYPTSPGDLWSLCCKGFVWSMDCEGKTCSVVKVNNVFIDPSAPLLPIFTKFNSTVASILLTCPSSDPNCNTICTSTLNSLTTIQDLPDLFARLPSNATANTLKSENLQLMALKLDYTKFNCTLSS